MTTLAQEKPTTGCEVTYRPDLAIGFARWLDCGDGDKLKTQYLDLLVIAREHTCYKWLLDVRRRSAQLQVSREWLFPVFLPLLQSVVGQTPRLAYVITPQLQEPVLERVYRSLYAEILVCETEKEAIDWLLR